MLSVSALPAFRNLLEVYLFRQISNGVFLARGEEFLELGQFPCSNPVLLRELHVELDDEIPLVVVFRMGHPLFHHGFVFLGVDHLPRFRCD